MRRSALLVLVIVAPACGGKLMAVDSDGEAATATDPTPPPSARPARDAVCERPVMSTRDFGDIDVSGFGCTCDDERDCENGEVCMTFASLERAHCVRTADPCSLVTCREHGTCVVGHWKPLMPFCYR